MTKRRKRPKSKKELSTPETTRNSFDELFDTRRAFDRRDAVYAGVIFAVALAIRCLYFFINESENPLFYHLILDSRFHNDWAIEIISGSFWGDEVFFRAPFYPYFLALIYKISDSSIAFAIFVQHLLGSLTCVLVYVLGRQFFAIKVALVAGLLASLYWPLIYFEGDLLLVTLAVFFDVALLCVLAMAVRDQRRWLFIVAGLVLGLSAITRPNILILLPVLPLFLSAHGGASTERRRAWIRQMVWVVAGTLVVVAPVIIRNYVVGRDIVPIASQGGVNFYIGNNPESNGSQARVPGLRADLYGTFRGAITMAEREVGRPLKPSEASNYYFKKGLDFIVFSPAEAAALTAKKLYMFWAAVERSNNKYIQFFWDKFGLGKIPLPGFGLVGPLGLLGGVLLWNRRKRFSLLYLFVLSYMVGVVIFFVNARFRLPVVPVLILFAAYSLCYLYTSFRSRGANLARTLIILAVCVVVVDYDYVGFRGVRAFDETVSYYELGNAYLSLERKDDALEAFERAHSIQQRYPTPGYGQIAGTVDYQRGALYREKGNTARAVAALERVHPRDPAWVPSRRLLALVYVDAGRPNQAIGAYNEVLSVVEDDRESLLGLARIYRRQGDRARSDGFIRRLRSRFPNDPRLEADIRAIQSH